MIIWKDEHTTLFRSALYETNSSVVQTDDCVIIVDPGWLPHEIEEIRQYVEAIQEERPLYLLFTHSDYDHIIGYKAFPDAVVIASNAFAIKDEKEKDDILEQIRTFDDEYYVTRNYEIDYPEVDKKIAGEEVVIQIGKTSLTFFQASGHNDDGIFTMIEPIGVFLAGDYFSDIEFPFISFNSSEYEKTVLKLDYILEKYSIQLFVTGHGTPTRNTVEMKKRQQESLEYIYNLRKLILEKNEEEIQQIINGCKFPRNMKKYHRENVLLFTRELENTGW